MKVHVTFSEGHDKPVSGEYMWALSTDHPDEFRINNIPFFADYGLGDIVSTYSTNEYDREIRMVIQPSGNLTVRLFFTTSLSDAARQSVASSLRIWPGVEVEWANSRLLAVSIPPRLTADKVVGEFVRGGVASCDLPMTEEVK